MPKSGTPEMSGGIEQPESLGAEKLESPTPEDIEEILSLGFDGLDSSNDHDTLHERRVDSSKDRLYRDFLKSEKHGSLFVVREEGRIVAFIAAKESAQVGAVERLRLKAKNGHQVAIIQKLLTAVERDLRHKRCTMAVVIAPNPNEQLQSALRTGTLSLFFKSETNDNEPQAPEMKEAA